MSEADWWLCPECQSLNNLSARKCYSCRAKKPTDAARASEIRFAADLVGPAVFLASDEAAYITGSILAIDGGWTAY